MPQPYAGTSYSLRTLPSVIARSEATWQSVQALHILPRTPNRTRSGGRPCPPVQAPRIPSALSHLSLRGAKQRGNLCRHSIFRHVLPIESVAAAISRQCRHPIFRYALPKEPVAADDPVRQCRHFVFPPHSPICHCEERSDVAICAGTPYSATHSQKNP